MADEVKCVRLEVFGRLAKYGEGAVATYRTEVVARSEHGEYILGWHASSLSEVAYELARRDRESFLKLFGPNVQPPSPGMSDVSVVKQASVQAPAEAPVA